MPIYNNTTGKHLTQQGNSWEIEYKHLICWLTKSMSEPLWSWCFYPGCLHVSINILTQLQLLFINLPLLCFCVRQTGALKCCSADKISEGFHPGTRPSQLNWLQSCYDNWLIYSTKLWSSSYINSVNCRGQTKWLNGCSQWKLIDKVGFL